MVSNWFTGTALRFDCHEKRRNILEKALFQRFAVTARRGGDSMAEDFFDVSFAP